MIGNVILASAIILALLCGWVAVQHASRLFAARHPEFGPAREEGAGCGKTCGCSHRDQCTRFQDPETDETSDSTGGRT